MRAEFGANVRNGATQAVVGTWSDLLFALSGRDALAGRLEVEARIRWVDPEFGRFGALSEDFYQFGAQATLRLDGAIDRQGVLRWNARYIAPLQPDLAPRVDCGLTAKQRLTR